MRLRCKGGAHLFRQAQFGLSSERAPAADFAEASPVAAAEQVHLARRTMRPKTCTITGLREAPSLSFFKWPFVTCLSIIA